MWLSTLRPFLFPGGGYNVKQIMQVRNLLPSYRVGVAITATITVIVAVVILFPTGEKQRKNSQPAAQEGAKDISPATITEEAKQSLSERPPGVQATVISEETKQSLSARSPDADDAVIVITPEIAESLRSR